jgi:hypothetical protein
MAMRTRRAEEEELMVITFTKSDMVRKNDGQIKDAERIGSEVCTVVEREVVVFPCLFRQCRQERKIQRFEEMWSDATKNESW